MKLDIAATFLVLGDATSRNLEFSHRDDVRVSYGEETITEANILEIRRRHQDIVQVHTFPKRIEALLGFFPLAGGAVASSLATPVPTGSGTSSGDGGPSRCECRQSVYSAMMS